MEYFSRREGVKEMSSKYITSCIAYSMIAAWVVEFQQQHWEHNKDKSRVEEALLIREY